MAGGCRWGERLASAASPAVATAGMSCSPGASPRIPKAFGNRSSRPSPPAAPAAGLGGGGRSPASPPQSHAIGEGRERGQFSVLGRFRNSTVNQRALRGTLPAPGAPVLPGGLAPGAIQRPVLSPRGRRGGLFACSFLFYLIFLVLILEGESVVDVVRRRLGWRVDALYSTS